jgi:hypothetical protein
MNLALLAAAGSGILVGAAIVASRFAVAEVPPLTLAMLRYAIGFGCLLPFAWKALSGATAPLLMIGPRRLALTCSRWGRWESASSASSLRC